MRHFVLLPLIACAGCASPESGPGAEATEPAGRDYATQIDVPSPDYAALMAEPRSSADAEIVREPVAAPPADAKAVGELWLARLEARDMVDGYGLGGKDDGAPISSFDTRMTAEQFDAWVSENGWNVPGHIRWRFAIPLIEPEVSEAAEAGIRIWPAATRRTGLQLEAAAYGQIFLRDGCFFVRDRMDGGTQRLAYFHAETGLSRDAEGYYVLINRTDGRVMGRLGERFMWAAPNPINPGGPSQAEVTERCGDYPVVPVGNPEAEERLFVTYPHLRQPPEAVPPPGVE